MSSQSKSTATNGKYGTNANGKPPTRSTERAQHAPENKEAWHVFAVGDSNESLTSIAFWFVKENVFCTVGETFISSRRFLVSKGFPVFSVSSMEQDMYSRSMIQITKKYKSGEAPKAGRESERNCDQYKETPIFVSKFKLKKTADFPAQRSLKFVDVEEGWISQSLMSAL